MVSKNIKYTIFERYPSILNTTIPLIDIFISAFYYLWIFLYFFYELLKNLFIGGPKGMLLYFSKFFKKEDLYQGVSPEIDYKINENSKEDLRSLMEDTKITKVNIYRGKKAFKKLKEVINDHNMYEYIDHLPITYFVLKEELMEGHYQEDKIYFTRGYSKQAMLYIDFLYNFRDFFIKVFKKNKKI